MGRAAWLNSAVAAVIAVAAGPLGPAHAQPRIWQPGFGQPPGGRFELSDTVRLDRADSTVRTYLDRFEAYLADGQWDEAVQTLTDVMQQYGDKLWGVTEERYVSLRDYCHLRLASLPPEALALYRGRVDPQAKKWYEEGIARRDRRRLLDVIEQTLASSWGDNALYALGEIALETADYAAARSYWEKVIPVDPPVGAPRTWLSVPETELDLAAVRARLVLASILEGSRARAEEELAALGQLHPDGRGRFGGREVNYVEALSSLLAESAHWPSLEKDPDWPTFAGSPLRDKVAPASIDPAGVAWRVRLRPTVPAGTSVRGSEEPPRRVAEDARSPLSYHPVLVGNLVLVNNQVEILALDLSTGEPAWAGAGHQIYYDQLGEEIRAVYQPAGTLGVPRFTMTVFGGKLYGRMGPAVTGYPREPPGIRGTGYLVCLDLEAEGRLVWKIDPPERELSFEGSPVADGGNVYVAMRQSDIQPQAHVACFDAEDGRLRWRRFVCAAETPARGMLQETTHNLLTLHRDTIYVNTNLGAVAALSTRDGRLKWVSLYPRVEDGDLFNPAPHFCRDLNPCLYHRGTLIVAPSDSRQIFGLDAQTGQILWQSGPKVQDAVHLLGVSGDMLIASGHKLYWISMQAGQADRVKHVWPDGPEKLGYGRGVLAGDCVWWPTREKIYLFDPNTGRQKRAISLVPRGLTGGNLLVAERYLLIATEDELVALGVQGRKPKLPADELAARARVFRQGHNPVPPAEPGALGQKTAR